jgi:hypothetical protein
MLRTQEMAFYSSNFKNFPGGPRFGVCHGLGFRLDLRLHTTTILVKVFLNIKAVPNKLLPSSLPVNPVEGSLLKKFIGENMSTISQTYASKMPDWVVAKYFDPEAEKKRVAIHDYQQTEIREM